MKTPQLIQAIRDVQRAQMYLAGLMVREPTQHFRHRHAADVLDELADWAERQPRGVDIDMADYKAMRRRAEAAETDLATFRTLAPFVADCLELYAHAQETGALDSAGQYRPEDVRMAIESLTKLEVPA